MRTLPARLVMLGSAAVIPVAATGVSTALASQTGPGPQSGYATKVSGVPASATVKETDQAKFVPADATVHVGQAVEWMNDGQMPHHVAFSSGGPQSDTMTHGATFELKFTKPGTYSYVCTFHQAQGMKGTITVSA